MSLGPDDSRSDDDLLRRPAPPRSWRDRIEHLADATGTTPGRIVVGGVGVIGVAIVALWLTRPPPEPPEVDLPFASTSAVAAAAALTPPVPTELVVHVAGAVVSPGVHALSVGARVVDAIKAAGGLTPEADPARINLAAPVADGERIYVLRVGEDAAPSVPGQAAGSSGGGSSALVNLNEADEAALDALPGVGPATAKAIIEHRRKIGRFSSVDQLLDVRGIGEAKLEQIRPLVTI